MSRGTSATGSLSHLPDTGHQLLVCIHQPIVGSLSLESFSASWITSVLRNSWSHWRWERWKVVPFPLWKRAYWCCCWVCLSTGDRTDFPVDYRYLHTLLQLGGDPEVGLGDYSQGVRVGPGKRMPRLPALYRPKKKWRRATQQDPLDYLEQSVDPGSVWRRNFSTLATFEEQVLEVMHDKASRGQPMMCWEAEARRTYPNLVIASLGAQRKEKPCGKVVVRVLFHGTHGLSVNTRT